MENTSDNTQKQYKILQLEGNLITNNQEKVLNEDKVHNIIENNKKHRILLCFPQTWFGCSSHAQPLILSQNTSDL